MKPHKTLSVPFLSKLLLSPLFLSPPRFSTHILFTLALSALTMPLFTPLPAYAMPNPQWVALANTAEFGKYVGENMSDIIHTTSQLAHTAIPNQNYFLVTKSVSITPMSPAVESGKSPFATLVMESGSGLSCARDVFMSVKADFWGDHRQLTFTLAPEVRCTSKGSAPAQK